MKIGKTQIAVALASLASFIFGLASDAISSRLNYTNNWTLVILILIGVALFYLSLRWSARRIITKTILNPPITLRTQQEKNHYARKGIMVFIPLFNPFGPSKAKNLTPEEIQTAVENLDYQALDLLNSNLEPAIEAIVTHAARIEKCWMITTTQTGNPKLGTVIYAPVLIEYLKQVRGINCEFFYGPEYCIPLDDDSLITVKSMSMVEQIIKEAESYGILGKDLIGDCASGIRSLMLGMILASIDKSRDVQFTGTKYNEKGRPDGPLTPILFDFEAKIIEEN